MQPMYDWLPRNENISQANLTISEYVRGITVLRTCNATTRGSTDFEKSVTVLRDGFIQSLKTKFKFGMSSRTVMHMAIPLSMICMSLFYDHIPSINGIGILVFMVILLASYEIFSIYTNSSSVCSVFKHNLNTLYNIPSMQGGNKIICVNDVRIQFENVSFAYEKTPRFTRCIICGTTTGFNGYCWGEWSRKNYFNKPYCKVLGCGRWVY